MAREKRPASPGNRPNLDYYEYKRRRDEQLRRTNPELAKAVAAQMAALDRADEAEAPRRKHLRRGSGAAEEMDVRAQDGEPALDVPLDAQIEKPAPDGGVPAPSDAEGEPVEDEADDLEEQVDHPFAEAAAKVKQFGGKLISLTASLRGKLSRKGEPEDDIEDEDEDEDGNASEKASGDLTSVLAIADDGASSPSRRARRAQLRAEDAVEAAPANERTGEQLEHAPIEAVAAPAPEVALEAAPDEPVHDVDVPARKPDAPVIDVPVEDVPAEAVPTEDAPRRVARKKAEPAKVEAPDEDDEGEADDADEPADKRRRFWPFGKLTRPSAHTGGYDPDEDDDDEDIAPSGGRFNLFGRKRAKDAEAELEDDIDDEDDLSAERLSARLAATLDEERSPRRRRKDAAPEPDDDDEDDARRYGRPGQPDDEIDEPEAEPDDDLNDEDQDEDRPPLDEPTQAFKPLSRRKPADDSQRTRRFKPVRAQEEPEHDDEDEDLDDYDDYDDADDEDDLPVRRYGRKPRRAAVRVYQDEDLRDDDEDEDDLGDARYDDEDDYYDDEFDDEETLSFGKRLLRFLKGLLVIVLILLLAVITLRQLESSNVLSLNILRNTVGVLIPLNGVFPTPAPTPIPTPSPEPSPTTPVPTPAVVIPTVTGETEPEPEVATQDATPNATASAVPPSMGVALPDNEESPATAAFLDDDADMLDDIGD